MEWIEVINVVKEVGTSAAVIGVVIYLLVKYFSVLIDNKVAKKEITTEEVDVIQHDSVKCLKELHPYFNKVNGIIDTKLPIVTIGGPVRTQIFRDALTIYFKTSEEEIYNLLNQDITLENFLSENYKTATAIVKKSNDEMQVAGIPEVVIKKFNKWNEDRYENLLSAISDIDSSSVFSSVVGKQYTVLTTYANSAYFILIDAEKTLKSLNGDLTGTIYKGKAVESLHE